MTLIGEIVRRVLSLKEQVSIGSRTPAEKQLEVLQNLLSDARDTAFGKYYGFRDLITKSDIPAEFRKRVPIYDYDHINSQWWEQQRKYPDITWPGSPDYFARTSGTTGPESKRIPVTGSFIQSMRQVGLDQLAGIARLDLSEKVFSSEALIISSSAALQRMDGHLEGEISGINVSNFPDWYELFYRPGKEISAIDDWDKRTDRIAQEAKNWDIGMIAGIPSWVQLCLKKVLRKNDVDYVDELWPNACLFISGGVSFSTYESSFRNLFRQPITVLDTYLASEGFFAYGVSPESLDMRLALSHGYYYEFIPFDERGFKQDGSMLDNPEVLTIDKVREGEEYALIISTCAGAWRYFIEDTITFTDTKRCLIRVTGRTKFWLNVVGSQLSEEKLDAAIKHIGEEGNWNINEYSVGCIKTDEGYVHQWILITDDDPDPGETAELLDAYLKEVNDNYQVARNKALEDVKVTIISKERYAAWLKKNKKMGDQNKIEKVMQEDDLRKFLQYLQGES